jgi:hypothetical protein
MIGYTILEDRDLMLHIEPRRDGEKLPWKRIAAELGIAESAIYLYGLDLDETGPADPLSEVGRVRYLTAAMTGMRQG